MKAKQANEILVLLVLANAIIANALVYKLLIVDNLGDNSGLLICTVLADVAIVVIVGIMIANSIKQQDKE